MSNWRRNSLLALLLAGAPAWAAGDDDAVVIKALRNPVDKSYRKMVKGMDLFEEEMRAMAPGASLRYKLLPRKRGTSMGGLALEIVGKSFELPVTVASDRTFALQRDQKALDEDASVRLDRKAHSMTWRTEIRTPGLPPNVRRLGDLRLECRVGMEARLVSHYPSSGIRRLIDRMLDTPELCDRSDAPYLFFSERPLFSVTLSSGARRQVLSLGELYAGIGQGHVPKDELPHCDCEALLDRAYLLPLGDRSWPNDTLVELEYMDAPLPVADGMGMLTGMGKADVVALFGEGTVIRFDSGFEVRAYPFAKTEFVVLFGPSGVVANTRLRQAPPQ